MKIPLWMIFLGFCAFVALSSGLGLVYISSRTQHVLVREDYYQAGIHLDEQKLRESGFNALNLKPTLKDASGSLVVELSKSLTSDPAVARRLHAFNVELFLQRPDDPSADRELALQNGSEADSDNPLQWTATTPDLRKGRWNCRLVFEDQGKPVLENSFSYYRVE